MMQAPPPVSQFYESPRQALRSGVQAYNSGHMGPAIDALQFAATRGDTLALWKLGRMHAEGDGVPADDLKAFEYFSKIADEQADIAPSSPHASAVANAFVALGSYFQEGISGTYVKPDISRAKEMYHYAATYFGDAAAQYHLARLCLSGFSGQPADPRQAARWLKLAADKNHYRSQALLGSMLIEGQGVPRQKARGFKWLILARDAADPARDAWLFQLYDKASSSLDEQDRQAAFAQVEARSLSRTVPNRPLERAE
jgi:uncharacterized protein